MCVVRRLGGLEAGAVISLYGLGGVAGTELGGRLTDRFGYRLVMLCALTMHGLLLFTFGVLESPAAISAGALALGLVAECFRPANSVAFASNSSEEDRPRVFGLHRLAINLGVGIGPVIGGFLAEIDYGWLFIVDGSTCLLAASLLAVLLRRTAPSAHEEEEDEAPADSPYRDGTFVKFLLLLVLMGLVFFQFLGTLPLYLREQRGLSESTIGLIFGSNAVAIVLFEMVLIQAIRRRNALRVTAVAGALVGIGFGLTAVAHSIWALVATVLIWTVGEMLALPMAETWVSKRARSANRGRYLASYSLAFNAAHVAAPLVGTAVYQGIGPDYVWYMATVLGAVQFIGLWRLSRRS